MYFVIQCSKGNMSIESMTKEELLPLITPDEEGVTYWGKNLVFLDNADDGYFENAPNNSVIIISGHIVVPKITVTTQYELPE